MPHMKTASLLFIDALPIGSYPVKKDWQHKRLIVGALAIFLTITYIALTAWNVLTQGKELVTSSTLLSNFESDKTTSCAPVTLQVGQSLYTNPAGTFTWAVTGVDADNGFGVGVSYAGMPVTANITSIGFTYYWSQQTYNYGVCANATIPPLPPAANNTFLLTTGDADADVVVNLCTYFDLSSSTPPAWAQANQHAIQEAFFDLGPSFRQMSFPNGTFPVDSFPPYGEADSGPPPDDMTVTPTNAWDLDTWISGISYTARTTGANFTSTSNISFGLDHVVTTTADNNVTSFLNAFEATVDGGLGVSGINLGLTGIGALQLLTQQQNEANGFSEPAAVTEVRSNALGIMNRIADMASQDLNQRSIASSFLCTKSSEQWKKPITIIALVLGNNSSLFSVFLSISIALAIIIDNRLPRRSGGKLDVEASPETYQDQYLELTNVLARTQEPMTDEDNFKVDESKQSEDVEESDEAITPVEK